ncbi:MAG: acyl-CoA dehydrogenase [Rhodobacterales bacterium 12-64-8]|nr:MAG: acyl-CoA dehydrogenase [Rhodobacterales bacterium 12-64-8]OYX50458.1 MAG: acyl-CoA dehydrogenase [Alphaproteobacteria bacterium 32-64-14]
MPYNAPISQIAHTLSRIARLDELAATGAFPNFDADLVAPILDEANKLARDVLAPLNPIGHKTGAKLTDAGVVAAPGLSDAYRQFVEGAWMSLAFPEAFGGQGLPKPLALAVFEMIHGANMAFGLCPLLSFGAIEALLAHGSPELQQTYLPKLISGEWTGAMNLTEPQAGSDVGALTTKAVPNGDGSYAITGQKIFITWGDHDMTPNIIQLVLARLPDAPPGSKGISLFVAPKFFVNADGSLGERNTFKCIGLEHKMGIHASPTCVMEYTNAKGWLVGEANKGLAAMFTMMNSARLNVGLEGVAVGEAALQAGIAYAQERKQGSVPGEKGSVAIIRHPDVQRMLATMAANVQAARAICYACGAAADLAEHHPDEATRKAAKAREDLLTPLAKAWSTDRAIDVTNSGVQIHGGMGFMGETAAAQFYLDARITPIYEGTNGIQSIDLVGRKLSMDGGAAMRALLDDVRTTARDARDTNQPQLVAIADHLETAAGALESATVWMIATMGSARDVALSGATNYLRLAGDVVGGCLLTRAALSEIGAAGQDADKSVALAAYFAEDTLARAPAAVASITRASQALQDLGAQLWA